MKQKLLTLLTLLVLCVTGAWADDTEYLKADDASGNSYTGTAYNFAATGSITTDNSQATAADDNTLKFSKGWLPGGSSTASSNNYTFTAKKNISSLKVYYTLSDKSFSSKDQSKGGSFKYKVDDDSEVTLTSVTGDNKVAYVATINSINKDDVIKFYSSASRLVIFGVYATYTADPGKAYKVTATSNNTNWGTASSSESSLDKGETATITATPKAGYEFTSWDVTGEGASLSSNTTNPTTLTIGTADAAVTANFTAIKYAITHNDATGGTYTISVAGGDAVSSNTTATIGQTITLVATPDDGYALSAWNVKDADNNDVTVTNNQFTMPAKAVTISPVFSEPIVLNTLFSMTNITGPTGNLAQGLHDVTADFDEGGSAEVYQNKSTATQLLYEYDNSGKYFINFNGSGGIYLHVSLPSPLAAGDVIDCVYQEQNNETNWKLGTTSSNGAAKALPYTLSNNDSFIGATDLFIFKDDRLQLKSLTISGQGTKSDFTVISSTTPTVAIGATSDIIISTSSTGTVTYQSSDESVVRVSDTGVISAIDSGTATITIKQDADETYRAGSAKITVTVPEVVFVKIKTLGGSSTKVTGTMDVTTGITEDVNLSSNRKMDKGKYVGFTLNGENAIQTGDIIEVKLSAAGQGGKFIFYDSKGDNPTELYNTNVSPDEAKVYRFVVPAAMNGVKTTYLRRGGDNSGINEKFNPVFEYIAICRPSGEITLNASGYATYSSATNFLISGAKAYEATLNTADKKITCTEVEAVPAGAGVLLFGDAGAKVAIINTTSADALTDNDLKGTTQADGTLATFDTAKYYYALSGDTFKHYTGAAFVENKAYFESDTELNSKAFTIVFDGETTGINAIEEVAPVTTKTRKVVKNGRLVIETANGEFTVSGARIK